MNRYVVTDEAKADLYDIQLYLAKEGGLSVAKYVMRGLRDAMNFLNTTPQAGHVREDLTDDTLKFWSVFSYLIVYDPSQRPIHIIRVLHGSRDVEFILDQPDNH